MGYCVAVFRSKTQVLRFIELMRSKGINVVTTNTPTEARIGCGISARFCYCNLPLAKQIITYSNLNTFYAFFKVEKMGMRTSTFRIY